MYLFVALVIVVTLYLCYRQYQRWEQYREDLSACEAIRIEIGNQLRDLLKVGTTISYPEITKICTLMTLTRDADVRTFIGDGAVSVIIELRRAKVFINVSIESIADLPDRKTISKLRR